MFQRKGEMRPLWNFRRSGALAPLRQYPDRSHLNFLGYVQFMPNELADVRGTPVPPNKPSGTAPPEDHADHADVMVQFLGLFGSMRHPWGRRSGPRRRRPAGVTLLGTHAFSAKAFADGGHQGAPFSSGLVIVLPELTMKSSDALIMPEFSWRSPSLDCRTEHRWFSRWPRIGPTLTARRWWFGASHLFASRLDAAHTLN